MSALHVSPDGTPGRLIIPQTVVDTRSEICRSCPGKCAPFRAGLIDASDPRQACPRAKWSCFGQCTDPALPSAAEQALNAGGAAYRAAQALFGGTDFKVSPAERADRQEICLSCPFFIRKSERCSKCGCFTTYKTYLKAEKCPIGRW
jgi:hypothetical protein